MSRILSPATPTAPPTPSDVAGTQPKRLKSKSSFSFSRRKSPSTSSKPPVPASSSPTPVQVVLSSSPPASNKEFATKSTTPSQRFDQSPRLPDHPSPRQSPVVRQADSHGPQLPAKTFEEDVRAGVQSTAVLGDEGVEDEMGDEMGSGYVRSETQEDSEEEKRRKRFSLRDFQLPAHEMDSSEFGLFGGQFGAMDGGDYDFASNAAFVDKPTMPLRLNTILPDSLHSASTISVSTQSDDNLDPAASPPRGIDLPRPRDKNLLDFPTPPSTHLPPLPPVVLPRRTSSLSPSLHSVPAHSSSSSPRASTTPIKQQLSPSTSNRSTPRVTREESLSRKSPAEDLEASLRALEIAEIGLGLSASESTNSIISTTSSMREELFFNYRAMSAHLKAQENTITDHSANEPRSQPMSLNSSQSSQPPNQFPPDRHPLSASTGSNAPSLASTNDSTNSGVPPRSTSSSPTNYRSQPVPDLAGRSPQPRTVGLEAPVVLSDTQPFVRPSPALDPERASLNVSPKSAPRAIRNPAVVDTAPIPSPVLPSGAPIWAESFPPALTPTKTSPTISRRSTPPARPPPSPSLPPLPVYPSSNPATPTLAKKKSFSLLRRRKSEVDMNVAPLPKEVEPPLPTSNGSRRSSESGSIDGSGGSSGNGKRKSKFSMFLPKRKEKGEVPPLPSPSSRTASPFPPTSPRFPSHSNSPSFIQREAVESEPPTPTQATFNSPTESRLLPPGRQQSLSPSIASSIPPSPTSIASEIGTSGQLTKSTGSHGPPSPTVSRNERLSGSTSNAIHSAVRGSDASSTFPLRSSSMSTSPFPLSTVPSTPLPPVVSPSSPRLNNDLASSAVESRPLPTSSVPVEPTDQVKNDQTTSTTAPPMDDFESLSKEAYRAMEMRHIPLPAVRKDSLVGDGQSAEASVEEVEYSKLPTSVSDEAAISGQHDDGQYDNAVEAEDDAGGMEAIAELKEDALSVVGPAGEGDVTLDDETDSEEDDVPLGTLPGALRMQKSLRLKNSSRSTSRNQANASKKSSLSSNSVAASTVSHSAPRRNPFEYDPTVPIESPPDVDVKLAENNARGSPNLATDAAQVTVGHSMLPQTDESVVRRQGVIKSPSIPLDQVISDSVLTLDHAPPPRTTPPPTIISSSVPSTHPPPHLIRQKSPPAPIDTAASNYARSTVESAPTLAATYGLNRQPSGSSPSGSSSHQRPALLTRNSHDSHSQHQSSRSRAGTLSSPGTSSVPNSRRPSSAKDLPTPTNSISSHSHSVPPQQPSPNSSTTVVTPPLPTQPIISKHRVYIVDHTRNIVVSATALTRCGDIIAEARAQGSLVGNDAEAGGYALWEIWRTLGVERPTREFELLADVIKSWSHESPNILIIRKTSMLSVLASHLRTRPVEPRAGWVTIEVKRGKWVKRWLELKETTLTHYKSEKLKEPIQLCQLASFDAFFVAPHTAKSIKAPKAFTFAIKSVLPSAHYENGDEFCHFVCVKLEEEREAWVKAIISARNGVVRTRERDVFASIATTAQGLTLPTTQQSNPNTTTTQSYRQPPHSNGLANPAAASRSKSVSHRPPPTLLQQHPQLSAPMVPSLSLDSRLHPPVAGSGIPPNGAAIGNSSRPNAAAWAGMSLHDRQQWLKGAQADARENGHTFLQF